MQDISSKNSQSFNLPVIPDLQADAEQETSTGLGTLMSDDGDIEPDSQCMLGDNNDVDDESKALGLEIIGEMPIEYPLI
jgi:hypothetical protein